MKLIFNDASEMTIQSASTRPDGSLLIKTISETEENLKTIFQDGMKTKKMKREESTSLLLCKEVNTWKSEQDRKVLFLCNFIIRRKK